MAASAPISRRKQLAAAACSIAAGLLVAGMVHGHPEGLRTPAWIAYVAGAAFVLAGACLASAALAIAWLQGWLVLGVVGCLFAVTAWIAFGPGARECSVSFGFLAGVAPEALCRGAFGGGALLLAVVLALVLRRLALPVRQAGQRAPWPAWRPIGSR